MVNIVIPMAGSSCRFQKFGYKIPKFLLPIKNLLMIELLLNHIKPKKYKYRFIIITLKKYLTQYPTIEEKLKLWGGPKTVILALDKKTEGQADTVLKAKELINKTNPLMIVNCDQYFENFDIDTYLSSNYKSNIDGSIVTMKSSSDQLSYILYNKFGYVSKVVEKEVISDEATRMIVLL